MIEYEIDTLNDENKDLIKKFTCVESPAELANYSSNERRRIIKHSKEMDNFLHNEAYSDQEKGLNKTYLFISNSKVIAYFSLCNDAIPLEYEERTGMGLTYSTIPAIKIARLAVDANYKHNGLGRDAIQYSALMANAMREYSGVVFLTLDCYEHRLSYYESNGFVKNEIQPIQRPYDSPISMRLWLEEYFSTISVD